MGCWGLGAKVAFALREGESRGEVVLGSRGGEAIKTFLDFDIGSMGFPEGRNRSSSRDLSNNVALSPFFGFLVQVEEDEAVFVLLNNLLPILGVV